MKKNAIVILVLMLFVKVLFSQENKSQFLFLEYRDATIHFRTELQSIEKVNYNLVENKLYFIDRSDKQIKIASGIDNIASIQIGDKSYVIDEKGLKEILSTNPVLILVQYKARSISKPAQVGYGGTSSVASVSTYSDYRSGGQQTILKNQDIEVSNIYNCYWIEKNNKKYKFENKDQFLKIYAKRKDYIRQYLQDSKVDFDKKSDIVKLVRFAEGLN